MSLLVGREVLLASFEVQNSPPSKNYPAPNVTNTETDRPHIRSKGNTMRNTEQIKTVTGCDVGKCRLSQRKVSYAKL